MNEDKVKDGVRTLHHLILLEIPPLCCLHSSGMLHCSAPQLIEDVCSAS